MTQASPAVPLVGKPTSARMGVLGFFCALSMITYLDRVCFGHVGPFIQREFGLTNSQLGWLFTAFAFAYAIFEVPSGWLGDVYGPKRTLLRIVFWWSAFTALTGAIYPSAAWPSLVFGLLLAVRFLFGVGEAGAYPNITRALHNWFPLAERGRAQGAVWMAGRFGGGITPLVVFALVYYEVTLTGVEVAHWRHMFWIFGCIGVVWCLGFWLWFRDRPEQHPAVGGLELAHIRGGDHAPVEGAARIGEVEKCLGQAHGSGAFFERPDGITSSPPSPMANRQDGVGRDEPSHAGVPWRHILGSPNLWLLCLMYFCAAYGWYFNITWLPKYLREQGVTEQSHGFLMFSLLSGAPLLSGSVGCLVGGMLTDRFVRLTGNRKWGRRLYGVVGHSTCAVCYFLCLLAQTPEMLIMAVALAAFCNDLTMGAAWASCQDIGRRYSGIVSGCMNTVGNLGGAAAGFLTGIILDASKGTAWNGWTVNFVIFGTVYVVAVFLWLFFDASRPVVPAESA